MIDAWQLPAPQAGFFFGNPFGASDYELSYTRMWDVNPERELEAGAYLSLSTLFEVLIVQCKDRCLMKLIVCYSLTSLDEDYWRV